MTSSAPGGMVVPDVLATGRRQSLFRPDVESQSARIAEALRDKRILIAGGAGSIGARTTCAVLDYQPAAVHVIDQNENALVELVRELRGRPDGVGRVDFQTWPLDYGSPVMARLLSEAAPYDMVMNFAAVKHVRSEKDIYAVLQMFDTNLVRHARFKRWLAEGGHGGATYFAVSTDKAANPVNLMGASKRLMEDLIFEVMASGSRCTSSTRFANVAFSNGSLLQGFRQRLEKGQPLAVPRDTRRYFISHAEAGELCLLATTLAPDRHILIPRLNPKLELQTLESVAVRYLEHHGLTPVLTEDEAAAKRDVGTLAVQKRWPILLTPLDTSGEKPFEEFVGKGETATEIGLKSVLALRHVPSGAALHPLLERLERLVSDPRAPIDKQELVAAVSNALANFRHVETGRSLDQRF